jgi:hypothetical protein
VANRKSHETESQSLSIYINVSDGFSDLAEHSEETIQPLVFNKMETACELVASTINATYRVQLIRRKQRCRLKCIQEAYRRRAAIIHESADSVRGFEILRAKILLMQRYEIETQKQFDTCQQRNAEAKV